MKFNNKNFKILIICIFNFFACAEEDSMGSSSSNTLDYNVNGFYHELVRDKMASFIYDRSDFCENDGYVYIAAGQNLEINMVGSVEQGNINIKIENINDEKSFNNLEVDDQCKIGGYQDGLFVNLNQVKYNYKSGIFETKFKKIVPSDFVERSQYDTVNFTNTIFINDQGEEIVINAEHEIVTDFIK